MTQSRKPGPERPSKRSVALLEQRFPALAAAPNSEELNRLRGQLVVFAQECGEIYRREREKAAELEAAVAELQRTNLATAQALAYAVEAKDAYSGSHLERCREYGLALAGELAPELVSEGLEYGLLLHDVGKIGIPETILLKPGPLTTEEARVVQKHPLIGVQIVAPLYFLDSVATDVIRSHHERYDGAGYPEGLRGEAIPLAARIFSVIDAFDAMTSDRPYRAALPLEEAAKRIQAGAGTQFDTEVAREFVNLIS